jgi:hypothetical protein
VETVPTPGKIPRQNRPFLKIPVLTGKKPASLAARQNAQKRANSRPCQHLPLPDDRCCKKNERVYAKAEKRTGFLPENKMISSPVCWLAAEGVNGTHDPFLLSCGGTCSKC